MKASWNSASYDPVKGRAAKSSEDLVENESAEGLDWRNSDQVQSSKGTSGGGNNPTMSSGWKSQASSADSKRRKYAE